MVTVMVSLARDLVWRPPELMEVDGESGSTRAYLTSGEQDFNSRSSSGTYVLEPTHALTFRLEGLTTSAPFGDHPYAYWDMRGAFAVSVLPKPGCVPTAQAPCDAMRVRAVFVSLVLVEQGEM